MMDTARLVPRHLVSACVHHDGFLQLHKVPYLIAYLETLRALQMEVWIIMTNYGCVGVECCPIKEGNYSASSDLRRKSDSSRRRDEDARFCIPAGRVLPGAL